MSELLSAVAPVWEVVLPDRRSGSIGTPKPKGTLLIGSGTSNEERIALPMSVARILSSKERAGEICPSSRAELLYVVGELSKTCASVRIERLINRREYSRLEVIEKLQQDGYSAKTIAYCVDRACSSGLISDGRYADSFIRSKVLAGWGMQRIARELRLKGIDVEELNGWPYEYLDPEDELNRAIDLAERRRVSSTNPYPKLVRYLSSRGFSLGIARKAASLVLAASSETTSGDEDW